MRKELLSFQFTASTEVAGNMLGDVVNKLNSLSWMGKEPRTCRVVKINIQGKAGGMAMGIIVVRHRPHGWKLRHANQDEQGRYIDHNNQLLPEECEPVIWEFDELEEVDFNRFNFGTLMQPLRECG